MLKYLLKRTLLAFLIISWAAFFNFVIMLILPGDFFTPMKIGIALAGLPVDETHEALGEAYGLNKHWTVQFVRWYGRVLFRGDFGYSLYLQAPIRNEFFRMGGPITNTLLISGVAVLIAWLVAIPVGMVSASRRGAWLYGAVNVIGMPMLAMPGFYMAGAFLAFYGRVGDSLMARSTMWGLCGYAYAGCSMSWGKFVSCVLHMLPLWIMVGIPVFVVAVKVFRSSIRETLGENYIVTARGKGLRGTRIYRKHILRNALNPLISTIGMMLPTVLVNAFLVSSMFGIRTYGNWVYRAVSHQDPALLGATMLFYSVVLVVGNLLADLGLAIADPRIRYG